MSGAGRTGGDYLPAKRLRRRGSAVSGIQLWPLFSTKSPPGYYVALSRRVSPASRCVFLKLAAEPAAPLVAAAGTQRRSGTGVPFHRYLGAVHPSRPAEIRRL